MAAINEAWHVLSDPERLAAYDESLLDPERPTVVPLSPRRDPDPEEHLDDPVPAGHVGRWGIPFLWIAGLIIVAAIFVFTAYAAGNDSRPAGDLAPGACVVVEPGGYVRRVPCSGPHDGVVESVPAEGQACPGGASSYVGRPELKPVCVR